MNKPPETRRSILSLYFISVSLLGLFLLVALTFAAPTKVHFSWQRPVVGSFFGLISLLGITAGVYPSRCSRMLHFKRKINSTSISNADNGSTAEHARKLEGHHPSCENFSAHVFHLSGKTYCAGCTGLVTGAATSFFGTLVFCFTELSLDGVGIVFFWLGFIGVVSGLLQYNLFGMKKSYVHLSLNVIFVVGAFLLLVGVEEITNNFILDGYLLILIVFWILTRVLLSQQEHRKVCLACGLKSCPFLE